MKIVLAKEPHTRNTQLKIIKMAMRRKAQTLNRIGRHGKVSLYWHSDDEVEIRPTEMAKYDYTSHTFYEPLQT